ncbi:MAG: hypothetical protein QOG50_555 [Actinomycetota bacterium]|nr:hypothetical protein [Actinomycetota bacterium]
MKPSQLARFAAVVLALAGVAALLAAAIVSLRNYETRVPPNPRQFKCGSVLFAKDPRNLAPPLGNVPPVFTKANTRCEKLRSDRTHKALTFMLAGAAPLLLVLALPFLSRRSRRSRGRRRVRM